MGTHGDAVKVHSVALSLLVGSVCGMSWEAVAHVQHKVNYPLDPFSTDAPSNARPSVARAADGLLASRWLKSACQDAPAERLPEGRRWFERTWWVENRRESGVLLGLAEVVAVVALWFGRTMTAADVCGVP